MPSITYPITAAYRQQWSLWDALREAIYQEFLDLFSDWTIRQADGRTVVEGRGAHMNLRNLLLGGSDKQAGQRGQFGEGTKLGWLILLREGVPFTLTSGEFHGLHARWADLCGEQVMQVCWDEGPFFDGSRYELEYDGDLWPERVVWPDDPRVLHQDGCGRMILDEADPQFYVQGLWVGPARPYNASCAFGYNFPDLPLAEDRQISDTWEATRLIGRIWAGVSDEELLTRFWTAVEDGRAEANAKMMDASIGAPATQRRAMQRVFGGRVVVATDTAAEREAEYRGLAPRRFPWGLEQAARDILGTDREELAALHGQSFTLYPRSQLTTVQRKVLGVLQRLAARAGVAGEVQPYLLPPNVAGQAMGDRIALDVSVLSDGERAIATWLHEAAHVLHHTEDATAAHTDAVASVAARVIASYAVR